MHCEKIETLTIISRSNAIMPGLISEISYNYFSDSKKDIFLQLKQLYFCSLCIFVEIYIQGLLKLDVNCDSLFAPEPLLFKQIPVICCILRNTHHLGTVS